MNGWSDLLEALGIYKDQRDPMAEQPQDHIMQFFAYGHLPEHLQAVSKVFAEAAESTLAACPRNPERTVALRKLLEAKDAAVRALVAGPLSWSERGSGPVLP